jgi:hypothetical protein
VHAITWMNFPADVRLSAVGSAVFRAARLRVHSWSFWCRN